jgi:hypothetical protein
VHEYLGEEIAIICSGYLDHYTYFKCSYEAGAMYASLEKQPTRLSGKRDALLVRRVIQGGISAFEFNHRTAVFSYLGEPTIKKNRERIWMIGSQSLSVRFDAWDRIECVETK